MLQKHFTKLSIEIALPVQPMKAIEFAMRMRQLAENSITLTIYTTTNIFMAL